MWEACKRAITPTKCCTSARRRAPPARACCCTATGDRLKTHTHTHPQTQPITIKNQSHSCTLHPPPDPSLISQGADSVEGRSAAQKYSRQPIRAIMKINQAVYPTCQRRHHFVQTVPETSCASPLFFFLNFQS